MGALCSAEKSGVYIPESKPHQVNSHPQQSRRLLKMSLNRPAPTPTDLVLENILGDLEFEDEAEYYKARNGLRDAEKALAFDAHVQKAGNAEMEKRAAELVKKIREYDRDHVYGPPVDEHGNETHKRTQGEHFLGNVELINKTDLFKVAREMPKGAHLHVHFNSCLPADFLIRQARDVDAMYIRSTLPLTDEKNLENSRISFMVQTYKEATRITNKAGESEDVGLGDIFSSEYIPNQWMRYKDFQHGFAHGFAAAQGRSGTQESDIKATEDWLVQKMHISEEEAHNTRQTGRGIWEKFNHRTQMMKGLFAYETAFRNYTKACIKDFVDDNIQYAEIRPNFMSTNSLKRDDGQEPIGNEGIMKIIQDELRETMKELKEDGRYFGGMKVIYCTPRIFDRPQVNDALNECIELKKEFPDLLCGKSWRLPVTA